MWHCVTVGIVVLQKQLKSLGYDPTISHQVLLEQSKVNV